MRLAAAHKNSIFFEYGRLNSSGLLKPVNVLTAFNII